MFLMTLTVFRNTILLSLEWPTIRVCLCRFLVNELRLRVGGRTTTEVKPFSSRHIKECVTSGVTGDVNLRHLIKVVFCEIFHFEVIIFPFPASILWK